MLEAFTAAISDINKTLSRAGEMAFDWATIAEVRKNLLDARDELSESTKTLQAVGATTVGDSYWGRQVAHHSELAYEKMSAMIDDCLTGLDQYAQAMHEAGKDGQEVDGTSTADLNRGSELTRHAGVSYTPTGQGGTR